MTPINKTMLIILGIAIFILATVTSSAITKIHDLESRSYTDISSSTIKVANGTTTIDVPVINILNYMSSEIFCINNPTADGCVAPATASATTTQ